MRSRTSSTGTRAGRWSSPSESRRFKVAPMDGAIRVMVERGRKKAVAVASAFDWPGWDRSGKSEEDALQVLDAYRPRYAKVAELAGLAEFRAAGKFAVVER